MNLPMVAAQSGRRSLPVALFEKRPMLDQPRDHPRSGSITSTVPKLPIVSPAEQYSGSRCGRSKCRLVEDSAQPADNGGNNSEHTGASPL